MFNYPYHFESVKISILGRNRTLYKCIQSKSGKVLVEGYRLNDVIAYLWRARIPVEKVHPVINPYEH